MVKKNSLCGLKLLLVPLFIMLLSMSSTCYALTPSNQMTAEGMQNIFTYFRDNLGDYYNFSANSNFNNWYNNANWDDLATAWNNSIISTEFDYLEQMILFLYSSSSSSWQLYILQNNNEIGEELPHVRINQLQQTSYLTNSGSYIDDNYNSSSGFYLWLNLYSTTLNAYKSDGFRSLPSTTVRAHFINDSDTLIEYPGLLGINRISALNVKMPGENSYKWVINNNFVYTYDNTPDEPSGDTSGDTSGDIPVIPGDNDYTDQLNNINNNITNSSNNIIQNNNENTDKIINAISGDTNKIINNINNTDTSINVSGEFSNMLSSTANVVDPTTNFFSWLLDNLRSVLNSTGNYNLEITLFNETYIIRSDFFILPDSDLKTFLQLAFVGWFAWHIIKKVRYIVYAVQCVNIQDALHQCDFNPDIL